MDARLQALERRWRETGAPSDEAALLRARVRSGEGAQARTEAADHVLRLCRERYGWVALGELDRRWHVVAAHAAVAVGLRIELALLPLEWARPQLDPTDVLACERALDALEAWAACPCERHHAALAAPALGDGPAPPLLGLVAAVIAAASRGAPPPADDELDLGLDHPDEGPGRAEALEQRLRCWREGPIDHDLAPTIAAVRASREERKLADFLHHLAVTPDVALARLADGTHAVPSRWRDDRLVVPILTRTERWGEAWFRRVVGVSRHVERPPGEVVHLLLPRWAALGLLVAPMAPDPFHPVWPEVEPLELQRRILATLPDHVLEEHRMQAAWRERQDAKAAAKSAKVKPAKSTKAKTTNAKTTNAKTTTKAKPAKSSAAKAKRAKSR